MLPHSNRPSRRTFLQGTTILVAAAASGGLSMPAFAEILSADSGAGSEKVRFPSGDSFVVGNLYLPADYAPGQPHPAVVIGGSLTSVKEQMGGIYALEMARRGFIALAIDYRHYGESGGEPRQFEDPLAKAEDLSAAVTYLSSRADVAANGVSLLGICTSGGTVLYTAARDQRILALACVASHLSEPAVTNPMLYGGEEGVARRRAAAEAARAEYERTGMSATILAYHDTDITASHVAPMEYYMDRSRGGGWPRGRMPLRSCPGAPGSISIR